MVRTPTTGACSSPSPGGHVVVGTTDTPIDDSRGPRFPEEIDFLMGHAALPVADPAAMTRSVFVIRPLVRAAGVKTPPPSRAITA